MKRCSDVDVAIIEPFQFPETTGALDDLIETVGNLCEGVFHSCHPNSVAVTYKSRSIKLELTSFYGTETSGSSPNRSGGPALQYIFAPTHLNGWLLCIMHI